MKFISSVVGYVHCRVDFDLAEMKEEVLNTEFVGKHFIQMGLTLKCAMSYKLFSEELIELCFKSRKQ